MDKKVNKQQSDDIVHIKQINPRTELNELEKTAILQFELEKNEKELSKTTQFKMLNAKHKKNEIDLPRKKPSLSDTIRMKRNYSRAKIDEKNFELPKKKQSLGDTIRIKISDLRAAVDEKNIELPKMKQKKSLYDTVIIKLDNLINNKNALKVYQFQKVTNVEMPEKKKKKFHFFAPKDITKKKNFHINVDSEEFGRQLYNLNKIALSQLSNNKSVKARKYSHFSKLERIEKVHISKTNYLQYQKKLSKFAINKLYYKFAPKETKKYQLYRCSVITSGVVLAITSLIIVNWFVQGMMINSLSHSLKEDTNIEYVNEGIIVDIPEQEEPVHAIEEPKKNNITSMYWKYLNTPLSSVDFTELLKQNKDTVGWLIVNNTNVNYPVVQTSNNDYYLKHAFDDSLNNAGWVFADFRNDFNSFDKNTVIYAHGRKDKVMFGSLVDSLKEDWYKKEENQLIQLSTIKYNTMWQIISIYKIKAESYYITTDFSSDKSFEEFIDIMKSRSIYDFGIDVNKDDKLLTLSTCYSDNGIRLVVQAKLVKIQER